MNLSIPNDFYSDSDEQPFTSCKVCNRSLTDGNFPYSIEKAYKKVEEDRAITLFEVAICMPCAEKQSQQMSEESRAYLNRMMSNSSFIERRQKLWESNWLDQWSSTCIFTNKSVKLNEEFHIVGHFKGNKVIPSLPPFIIGQEFIEEIQANLSAETKEEMNRFGNQFLGPDPTLKALLNDHQFVMI